MIRESKGTERPRRRKAKQPPDSLPPDNDTVSLYAIEGKRSEDVVNIEVVTPYDETLLDICRTRWQFGDWTRLADIAAEELLHHPDRARIALLVAAAHFQLDRTQQAHRLMQLALDWGASQRQAAQILLSGIHHSLAEAQSDAAAAYDHYCQALRTGGVPGDVDLLAYARAEKVKSEQTR